MKKRVKNTPTSRTVKMPTKLSIIVLLGISFIVGYLFARERYKPQIDTLSSMVIERDDKITILNNLRNRIIFQDGQLVQSKDGAEIIIEENVLLTDGSRVTIDGKVIRPNMEVVQLQEGDSVFTDGTILNKEEVLRLQEK